MTERATARRAIELAIKDPDRRCVRMVYETGLWQYKLRKVSPTSWVDDGKTRFNALCLGDGTMKQFVLHACHMVQTVPAHSVSIPEAVIPLTRDQFKKLREIANSADGVIPPKPIQG